MRGDYPVELFLARTKRAPAILYLDYDGVLQSEHVYQHRKRGIYIDQDKAPGRVLFEWAHHLVDALQAAPDVKVVLSTSWVRHPGFGRALRWLPAAVQARVIGSTFHKHVHGADPLVLDAFVKTPRGLQVWADVQRRLPRAWCALDDDVDDWPEAGKAFLVACHGEQGLSDPATRENLARHLARLQAACEQPWDPCGGIR